MPDEDPFGWSNEGRDSEECRKATVAAYVGLWRLFAANWIEAFAAAAGLTGAFLLASKGEHAAWGWAAFLASNVGWIVFGWRRRYWFLLVQQAGFTIATFIGIWTWLLN